MDFIDSFMEMERDKDSPSLKDFIKTEYLKSQFIESIKNSNRDKFLFILKEYYKEGFSLAKTIENALVKFQKHQINSDVVFIKNQPKQKSKEVKIVWDYKGRYFNQWIHMLAKTYGWSLEQILNLNINFAAFLIQEILVDQQLEREWQYSLSENAYQYDKNTKKSKFVPLNKPFWMTEASEAKIEKIRIPQRLLPHGVVVVSGIETPNAEEYIKEEQD